MSTDSAAIRESIREALGRVPAAGDGSVLGTTDTEIQAGDGTLQLGRSGTGELVALVPAPPDSTGMTARAGISLTVQQLRRGPDLPPRAYLVLTCHRKHLESTFLDLVALMAELFMANPANAADTMVRQYVRWRELFADLPRSGLSTGQVAGLLAELTTLSQICDIEGPGALDTWLGPDGARHDFHCPPDSLEIKAVVTNMIDRVTIHGVEQLLPPPDGELHLGVFRFEPDTGDETIAGRFSSLVEAGVDPLGLREKLNAVGVDVESDAAKRRWRCAEQRLYEVDSGLPRIVPSSFVGGSVPASVSDVRYSISLAGVTPVGDELVGATWRTGRAERP